MPCSAHTHNLTHTYLKHTLEIQPERERTGDEKRVRRKELRGNKKGERGSQDKVNQSRRGTRTRGQKEEEGEEKRIEQERREESRRGQEKRGKH